MIPLSDAVKTKTDVAAVGAGFAAYFQAIPWTEVAGFLSSVYIALRIAETLWTWWKKR